MVSPNLYTVPLDWINEPVPDPPREQSPPIASSPPVTHTVPTEPGFWPTANPLPSTSSKPPLTVKVPDEFTPTAWPTGPDDPNPAAKTLSVPLSNTTDP